MARRRTVWWALLAPIIALITCQAVAQQVESEDEDESRGVDDVGNSIERRNELRTYYKDSPIGETLRPWDEWREQFFKDIGIELRLSYDACAQSYIGDNSISGFAGEIALEGRWFLFGDKIGTPTHLGFRLRDRHRIGKRAPSDIDQDIGAYWNTVRGFSNAGFEVPDFFLETQLFDDQLAIRLGQMDIKNLFDGHNMRSSKQAFANIAFSESPGVAFPRFGAGLFARWDSDSGWDVSIGTANIQGTTEQGSVDFEINRGELFSALQFGYKFDGWRNEAARLQLLTWHADPVADLERPEGKGASLVFEQRLCDGRDRLFARYSFESGGSTEVDHIFAVGYGTRIREFDRLGVALGVGRKNDTDQWQWVGEAFYRWQVWSELIVHPTMQILYGDGFHDGNGPHFIAGLHGQVAF